ncbi:MAG TPA: phage minor head protein [Azoarcus taiwanensis]|nr:phage minor head protein [Azoarcus taiwanensis]
MATSATLAGVINRPFAEQVAFFRRKVNLPTEYWDDIREAAHDRAFVVAGAMKADLLDDLRQAVDKAVAEGTSLRTFRQDFREIVARRGWTGWTGEGTPEGEAWRTRVIYETNLRTSYAAGRHAQLTDPTVREALPYWRYVHSGMARDPRPDHLAWSDAGLTLPADHPFWDTHYPPNGWGCRCRVVAVREPGPDDSTEPPEGWDVALPSTGAPRGIDPGWAYAPGANAETPLADLVAQKLIRLDAPLGAEMWAALRPAVQMEQRLALANMVDSVATTLRATGDAALVTVVAPATVAALGRLGHALESADVWLRDEDLLHALRDSKAGRGAALPLRAWRDLPLGLAGAQAYWDNEDPALVYALDTEDGLGKVLVRVNYREKLRQGNRRTRLTSNFIRTGGVVEERNLREPRYVRLPGV